MTAGSATWGSFAPSAEGCTVPDDDHPFDSYADAFTVTITPFGANLTFQVREAHPSAGKVPQIQELGTIRMSVEHLKTMVMILRTQVVQSEGRTGVKFELPRDALNQMNISPEDWDAFWRQPGDLG